MAGSGTGNFGGSDSSGSSGSSSDSSSGSSLGSSPARQGRGHGWLRNFALASVISTFALIVLGGVVRVTGSGLGCGGEWPLCDGSIIPPLTTADIIEYSHRLVASAIVGPLILITCAIAWLRYRRVRSVVIPATVAVILLLAQGGLGGVTVLTELPGHIVAAHLALAQALLGCLILVLVSAYRVQDTDPAPRSVSVADPTDPTDPGGVTTASPAPVAADRLAPNLAAQPDRFPRLAAIAAIATYFLLLSGAYVTATPGALAACPDWPLCQGFSLPAAYLQAIHMLHRVVAGAVGILVLYTLYRGYWVGVGRFFRDSRAIIGLPMAGGILFVMQIMVGAFAIWTNFPVELRAYHIALATAVWAIMAALALLSREPPVSGSTSSP